MEIKKYIEPWGRVTFQITDAWGGQIVCTSEKELKELVKIIQKILKENKKKG